MQGSRVEYRKGECKMSRPIQNARSHLRVALSQVTPQDDAIIVGHMRDALTLLQQEFETEECNELCADRQQHVEPCPHSWVMRNS
jgi:hypothetical protein